MEIENMINEVDNMINDVDNMLLSENSDEDMTNEELEDLLYNRNNSRNNIKKEVLSVFEIEEFKKLLNKISQNKLVINDLLENLQLKAYEKNLHQFDIEKNSVKPNADLIESMKIKNNSIKIYDPLLINIGDFVQVFKPHYNDLRTEYIGKVIGMAKDHFLMNTISKSYKYKVFDYNGTDYYYYNINTGIGVSKTKIKWNFKNLKTPNDCIFKITDHFIDW